MYWGSVRFFKHMILLTILLTISALTIALVATSFRVGALSAEVTALRAAADFTNPGSETQTPDDPAPTPAPFEAEVPSYQALYPDLYCERPAVFDTREGKVVYLTFDDGPSQYTAAILDKLKEQDIKASFFIIGRNIKNREALLRRILDEGHTLGIHTYTHELNDIYVSVESFLADFSAVYEQILEVTGVAPTIFRFPGGSINGYNTTVYHAVIAEMLRRGFTYYDWNISAGDASSSATAQSTQQNILNYFSNYDHGIVLLHEKSFTAGSLDRIITKIREAGYAFAPLTNHVKPVVFIYTG